jgi:DNA repair ATPase RecN
MFDVFKMCSNQTDLVFDNLVAGISSEESRCISKRLRQLTAPSVAKKPEKPKG